MKNPEDLWGPHEGFENCPPEHPPFEEPPQEDGPQFTAIRRIELLGRLHHMAFRSLFREDGLPPAQASAMSMIIRHPGLSQRELADKLHIQRATATVMLQKMEKAGYIDRLADREDQRISRIYPTETAVTMDTETHKHVSAYFDQCFAGVSPEDFETTMAVLAQVRDNLREVLGDEPLPPEKE